MKTNIINYLNKLQGYKTAIQNLHWSSKHMSEHKLLDEIANSVSKNQDEIAEICQGLYGKIKLNELKPKRYKITNSKKMLHDMLRDTKSFYSSIKGRDLTGARSVVETFIGEINKFVYLMEMCIKEDIKRNFKTQINETINLNETELRSSIQTALKNVLTENVGPQQIDDFWENFNETVENKIYSIESNLNNYKNEIEYLKKTVQEIIRRLQSNKENGNIEVDFDEYLDSIIIHVEMPYIQNFENDEDIDKIENEQKDDSFNVNYLAVKNLAVYCKHYNKHISIKQPRFVAALSKIFSSCLFKKFIQCIIKIIRNLFNRNCYSCNWWTFISYNRLYR